MKSKVGVILFTVLCITQAISALNILALGCQNSRSHVLYLNTITTALLEKGHHVYELITTPTPKHPNRTTFAIKDKIEPRNGSDHLLQLSALETSRNQNMFSVQNCESAFKSKAAHELLSLARDPKRSPKIDVVVVEYLFGQCLGAFAKEFGNAPIVAVTAFRNPSEVDEVLSAPTFPSFVPHDVTTYSRHATMTWVERLRNKLVYLMYHFYRVYSAESAMDDQLQEFFGADAATIQEVEGNISVLLVNSHPAVHGARPQLPAVVEIGGIHVPPLKEIPGGELKDFLDSAKDGFILVSFGSLLRSTSTGSWQRKDLMRAFGKLKPLRVVMKWDDPWNSRQDGPLPTNILISKWLPQSDILGHPNIRLYVTHCGLMTTFETIARAVPIVAVPLSVDEFLNAKSLADVNVGTLLPFNEFNEESLYNAIKSILNDSKYAKSVRRLSALLQDQTPSPKERAVYWVEFVARHAGALHLRSPAEKLPWVARWMVDDILILFVLVIGIVVAVRFLVNLCIQIRLGEKKMKEE